MTVRVLVADDHARFRAMVVEILEAAGLVVCAQAATGDAAVALALAHRPDVALVDIRMPGDGITAARRISAALPDTRVLMLTVSADADDVLDALQAGADGYVLKGAAPETIPDAVIAVHNGEAVLTPAVAPAVVQEVRRARDRHMRSAAGTSVQLTDREWTILQLLDRGEPTSTIAETLFVAPVTVRTHIAALTKKLQVAGRDEALALYRDQRGAAER